MHSSHLRGTDFKIEYGGESITHTDFFAGFSQRDRLGLLAPRGIEGVGAVSLIMAYVTAFYDTYRATGTDFFAYPSFYTFQAVRPLASYTMLDIWPPHKDVWIDPDPVSVLHAINDRAINILLLPEGEITEPGYEEPQIEAALRTIDRCFLYNPSGRVNYADLHVTVHSKEVVNWAGTIFDKHDYTPNPAFATQKERWLNRFENQTKLTQSFSEMSAEEALARI